MPDKFEPEYLEVDRISMFDKDYITFLFNHIKIEPGMLIVEPGCGTGFLLRKIGVNQYGISRSSRFFKKRLKRIRMVGIDCDPNLVHYANEISKMLKLSSVIDFKVGDAYNIPLIPNSADLAICHLFLCNLKEPLKAVQEMVRITKKGGTVAAIESYNAGNIYYAHNESNERIAKLIKDSDIPFIEGYKKLYGGDLNLGPKVPSLFLEAGLDDIRLYGYLLTNLTCDSRLYLTRPPTKEEIGIVLNHHLKKCERQKRTLLAGGMPESEIDELIDYGTIKLASYIDDPNKSRYDPSVQALPMFLTIGKKK